MLEPSKLLISTSLTAHAGYPFMRHAHLLSRSANYQFFGDRNTRELLRVVGLDDHRCRRFYIAPPPNSAPA